MTSKFLFALVAAVSALSFPFTEAQAQVTPRESVIRNNDRIVFVGDSITGQGAKGGKGAWIAMIGEGLGLVHPDLKVTLVGLGGSGSTVGAWQGFEKRSRAEPLALDVKETDVGKTLDAGAEIVVVMLGMNDVLSPSLKNDPADFDAWIAHYAELIEALRARSHPRVVALATITPCTEDPQSPKNQVMAELNRRIAKLAAEKQFPVLPTNEAMYDIQTLGRSFQPFFHVTGDFVHPNAAGHLAIAAGMLRGLGEEAASARLRDQHAALWRPTAGKFPTLSYTLSRNGGSPDDESQHFVVRYQWTAEGSGQSPVVRPIVPNGWKSTPESITGARGQFEFTGPLDHSANAITLTGAVNGGEKGEQVITIPAGWRIATGGGNGLGWVQNTTYDPDKDRQPLDESLAKGEGLTQPVPFPVGDPGLWTLYVPGNDYTGLNRSGSVDMAAVVFFRHHQQAYGARWIHSEKDRPVTLPISSQSFAGTYSLGVWLNGKPAYEGKLMGEPGHKVSPGVTLQRGWNLLVFKTTFIQWQWQFSIDVAGQDGDDLSDLRYVTRPPR